MLSHGMVTCLADSTFPRYERTGRSHSIPSSVITTTAGETGRVPKSRTHRKATVPAAAKPAPSNNPPNHHGREGGDVKVESRPKIRKRPIARSSGKYKRE